MSEICFTVFFHPARYWTFEKSIWTK